jgi:predicted HTH transcriptional regulator
LKQLFGASSPNFESTSLNFGATSTINESTSENIGAISHNNESSSSDNGASSLESESTSPGFESTSSDNGATLYNNDATLIKSESSSHNNDTSSSNNGALSPINGDKAPSNGATSPARELVSLIERSAREALKIYYSQPNIPSRMAEIVLALRERKKLSVTEMRQITGVSRNSLVRDIQVLKRLGWLEFHGSRKNGYFTLTATFPGF